MQLSQYLAENGLSQQAAARLFGCTQGRISQLLAGQRPSLDLADIIHDKTRGAVTHDDWRAEKKKAA